MRNTGGRISGTWATFVATAREASGLSKVELARRLGVDRATVSRWESGITRPEVADVVQRLADLLALDLEDALIAAGLRPASARTERVEPAIDPDVLTLMQMLNNPDTPADIKAQIRTMLRALAELANAQPPRPKPRRPPRKTA